MSTLKIGTYENKTNYRPGEEVAGRALWILDEPPKAVEVRLFWYTEGKGTQDVELIDSVRFDAPLPRDQKDFRFTLPAEPYSFSGKLISLIWALELVALPSDETERLPITVSPAGCEILLHQGEEIELGEFET
ncbi:MAG: hypothetical protein ABIF82_02620 [Planctomycetota bacterium]